MKANELNVDAINFFKSSGLLKSKETIKMSAHALVDCGDGSYFHINQLKRLVTSYELVESMGGLENAKKEVRQRSIVRWVNPEVEALRGAIGDVESCGGGHESN